ncbi:MAG TPA: type II toxin-antitoxin system RelE/ParE family toxin [Terracidiphilus sp.]|jgi:toxin ParE1/3/4|nr:type II toxin-antitoxin system RelE/ParE family toxin [Terracidiphilus sp.]
MTFSVRVTAGARKDLRRIHDYISQSDSRDKADSVALHILKAISTLENLPMRGVHPPELLALGNRTYREVFFKPYRIIYRVQGELVFVALIADGRREMHSLLSDRLLRP